MEWYESEVRALEGRLKQARLPEHPAAFYGSSSIRMWSDLAADLHDRSALNIGFGGSTLAACARFFARLVPPVHPASLVVYAGDNDLGDGRSPAEVLDSFRSLADLVDELLEPVPFGFMSIKLSPIRAGLKQSVMRTNELIQEEIAKRPHAYYIDIFDAMLDSRGQPRRELFLEDGLHLSRAGYQLWAQLLKPFRNQIFIPPSPQSQPERLSSKIDEP